MHSLLQNQQNGHKLPSDGDEGNTCVAQEWMKKALAAEGLNF